MTYLELQPELPSPDHRRARRFAPLLILLFLALLGLFILLMRMDCSPRASLPNALGLGTKHPPSFSRTLADVPRPLGVAVSPDGSKIYVAEGAGSYAVKVFDAKGSALGELTPPHTDEGTRQPMGVAVAPDGTVYVSDRRLNQVLMFNPDGTYRDIFRPLYFGKWSPLGVAVDKDGQLYVTETTDTPGEERHRVYVFQPDGTLVRWFGQKGGASSDLMFPDSIAVDGKGRIWVSDITAVKAFSAEGTYLFSLPTEGSNGVALPGAVAYSGGKIYATDTVNHRAIVVDVTADAPKFESQFGEAGFGNGQLRYPGGIAVSASRIYIANRENGRVDTWTP